MLFKQTRLSRKKLQFCSFKWAVCLGFCEVHKYRRIEMNRKIPTMTISSFIFKNALSLLAVALGSYQEPHIIHIIHEWYIYIFFFLIVQTHLAAIEICLFSTHANGCFLGYWGFTGRLENHRAQLNNTEYQISLQSQSCF